MKKQSLNIMGHATSISMEPEFWEMLHQLTSDQKTSLRQVITQIDLQRTTNLSSAVRVYILKELQKKILQSTSQNTQTTLKTD